ncbi:hypothetical protein P171DRAFT_504226 [Karstenula rhodostoma CBS 690.94]|uniref:Uncharacterized protein n=1 Tax=Karstenula rhodostoma CBS 690.94 TaxID=1392251 RepID=A0A9P4U654_9PLEO|nr:hypothetical protein P171DRAFT_504226 [Karstenula rhodostoma CBS 690.94]
MHSQYFATTKRSAGRCDDVRERRGRFFASDLRKRCRAICQRNPERGASSRLACLDPLACLHEHSPLLCIILNGQREAMVLSSGFARLRSATCLGSTCRPQLRHPCWGERSVVRPNESRRGAYEAGVHQVHSTYSGGAALRYKWPRGSRPRSLSVAKASLNGMANSKPPTLAPRPST